MIAIINYNMGNLASVYNACRLLDKKASIVSSPDELKNYTHAILPGVGAFKDAMRHLNDSNMKDAIVDFAKSGKPMFGICLGMQLLFDSSDEFGFTSGLGLVDGRVVKFEKENMNEYEYKIPHMGWNKIHHNNNKLFNGVDDPYLYFVHSHHIITSEKNIIAKSTYGYEFTSSINKDNIYGLQPHPEKSHENGIKILKNFMEL